MKRTLLLILGAFLVAGCAGPARRETLAPGDFEGLERHLGEFVRKKLGESQVEAASVVVVDGQSTVLERGYGFADKEGGRAADADSLYCVGSVTKLFTASALMRLQEQGKVDIDRPLAAYLPDFSIRSRFPDAPPITLRSMLAHQSGLPSDRFRGFWGKDPERYVDLPGLLKDDYLAAPPWHAFRYSNVGFSLLGSVVERAAGVPYARYVEDSILRPTGMDASGFEPDPARRARTYAAGRPSEEPRLRDVPAGGLFSSARDLGRFMRMIMAKGRSERGVVLQARTLEAMLAPQNDRVPLDLDTRIGLAWMLDFGPPGAGRLIGHGGATLNYHTQLVIDTDNQVGVAVTTNSRRGGEVAGLVAKEALDLAREARTGKAVVEPAPPAPKPASEIRPDAIRSDAGLYSTGAGLIQVESRERALRFKALGLDGEGYPLADGTYGIRLLIFGFFPFETADMRKAQVVFRDIGGRHVVAAAAGGKLAYFGERIAPAPIPESWRRRIGPYDFADAGTDAPIIKSPALAEESGVLVLKYGAETTPFVVSMPLGALGDDEAILLGTGRNLGETVRAVRRGDQERLIVSGLELAKAK